MSKVTEAQIELALDAKVGSWQMRDMLSCDESEHAEVMRIALEAALSQGEAVPMADWSKRGSEPKGGQRDDSPMAKMAAALRGKAEAERAAFDQRVQSGEWGPMPDNPDVLELPPLPEEVDSVRCMIRGEKAFAEPCDYYFTSKQMRDYARTALAATGKQSGRDIGAFELWAKSAGLDTKIYDHNGMYSHPVTRGARLGWQAATASRETGEK